MRRAAHPAGRFEAIKHVGKGVRDGKRSCVSKAKAFVFHARSSPAGHSASGAARAAAGGSSMTTRARNRTVTLSFASSPAKPQNERRHRRYNFGKSLAVHPRYDREDAWLASATGMVSNPMAKRASHRGGMVRATRRTDAAYIPL